MGDPRLAYVVWNFPKLSETFIVEELTALAEHGLRPEIIALERPDGEVATERAAPLLERATWLRSTPATAQFLTVARVAVRHPLRLLSCLRDALRTRSRHVVTHLWFACVLADLVRRRDIRYLHAHFADTAGDLAYFAARLTGVRYGITAHAVDIYLGHLLCQKLAGASLWVTVCEYNLDQIEERCPAVARRGGLVKYAGVDTDRFQLDRPRPRRDAERLLAIGRLTPKKGFDQLIEAVARLRAEGHHPNLRCTIIGSGRSQPDLERLIAGRGLDGVVELVGDLSPEAVRDELAASDVLVAPCTIASTGNRDSMPVVIKEAMAMELPVVATDDFGIPEMVNADTGALFPRDDIDALVDALRAVVQASPDERAAMGRAGRELVIERFDERDGAALLAHHLHAVLES